MDSDEFIFLFDMNHSTYHPADLRYAFGSEIEFGRLSSVSGHNRFGVKHLVTVVASQMDSLQRPLYLLPGQTLIMSRFKPDNIMHLIHDDLLPLFSTFRQFRLDAFRDLVFIDDDWDHTESLRLFKALFPTALHKNHFPAESIVCFENAHIGMLFALCSFLL